MKEIKKAGLIILFFVMNLILPQISGSMKADAAEAVTLKVKNGTDITDELQNALDKARDNKSGMYTITIPAGSYKIRGPLKMYSNTCLSMKGATLKRTSSNTMLRLGSEPEDGDGYSRYSGFKNIKFEGGTWDGAGESTSMIRLGHAQNITFKNVTLTNVKNTHHMEMAAVKNVTVSGCTFKNFTGSWQSTTNYEALQFDVMHQASQFSKYGDYDDTPCQNVTVTNCTFKHVSRGVGTHSAVLGSYFDNMVFTNNTFEDVAGYAIICSNYRNSRINNNTMKNCGSGIFFRTMAQNHKMFFTPHKGSVKIQRNAKSEIKNNVISATVNGYKNVVFGISLYGENVTKNVADVKKGNYKLEGVTVEKNKITLSCKGYGIWLQGANNNKLLSNTVTCNIKKKGLNSGGNGDGIRIMAGTGNTVQSNKITNKVRTGAASKMTGIYIESSDKTALKGNTVTGCSKDGISVKKSKNVTIKSNKSTKNVRDGIRVENSTATASGNKTSGNRGRNTSVNSGSKVKGKL